MSLYSPQIWCPDKDLRIGGVGSSGVGSSAGRGSGVSSLIFDVDFNSTIVPSIGTAGTFTRSGGTINEQYPTTGLSTITQVASGAPAVGVKAHLDAFTTSVNGGYQAYGTVTNLLQQSDDLATAPWTKAATATVLNDQARGPYDPGSNNAALFFGSAAGDYIDQDSNVTAASSTFAFGIWMMTNDAGPHNVDIVIQDEAGSPAGTARTVAVTGTWQQFVVRQAFGAGATGTAHAKVIFGNTIGSTYAVYAFGAVLVGVNSVRATDIRWDFNMLPYIPTAGATATLGVSQLVYQGSEIQKSFTELSISTWFYFCDHNPAQAWDSKNIIRLYTAGFVDLAGLIFKVTNNNVFATLGDSTENDTGDNPSHGVWHHIVLAVKSGDNEVIMDGTSIYTNATAWGPLTGNTLIVGRDFDAGGHDYTAPMEILIGRTQVYNRRLTASQAAAIYNTQKSGFGL